MGCCSSVPDRGNDVPPKPVQLGGQPGGQPSGHHLGGNLACGNSAAHHHGCTVAIPPAAADPLRTAPPIISHQAMSSGTIGDVVATIAYNLQDIDYVLIGGVAIHLLGSQRATADIDLLVPNGRAGQVAEVLGQTGYFGTERLQSGRSRVWYNSQNQGHYNVDIIEPGDIYQTYPDHRSGIMTINGTPVLTPALLLDYKCIAWTTRQGTRKGLNDAQDILFLLQYMASSGIRTSLDEVHNATEDFFAEFLGSYPSARGLFEIIGLL